MGGTGSRRVRPWSPALGPSTVALLAVVLVATPVAGQGPTADFDTATNHLEVSVDASESTSAENASIESYTWSWGDGSEAASGRTAGHSYEESGRYTIELTVRDDRGRTDTDTRTVEVTANRPPDPTFEAHVDGTHVVTDASDSSDPDGTIETYQWEWGDGDLSTGISANHTYDEAGEYRVQLNVWDDDGAQNLYAETVTVEDPNQPPEAAFDAATADLEVEVDASGSSDPDGDELGYRWSWGDGDGGRGAEASHRYDEAGTYTVELTVEDPEGASDTAQHTVEVASSSSGSDGGGSSSDDSATPPEDSTTTSTSETSSSTETATGSTGGASSTASDEATSGPESKPRPGTGDRPEAVREALEILDERPEIAKRARDYAQGASRLAGPIDTVRSATQTVLDVRSNVRELGGGKIWDLAEGAFPGLGAAFDVIENLDERLDRLAEKLHRLEEAGSRVHEATNRFRQQPNATNLDRLQAAYESAEPVYESTAGDLRSLASRVDEAARKVGRIADALDSVTDTPVVGGLAEGPAQAARSAQTGIADQADGLREEADTMDRDATTMSEAQAVGGPSIP